MWLGNADEDADAKLTQKDYQRALQGEKAAETHDPRYINFLTRISRGGSKQVLRYCRNTTIDSITDVGNSTSSESSSIRKVRIENKGRLYLSSDFLVKESSCKQKNVQSHSSCRRCGAPQLFEFQVMNAIATQACRGIRTSLEWSKQPLAAQGLQTTWPRRCDAR